MKKNEYQCDSCKGIFKKGWSEEERQAEYEKNFPDHQNEPTTVVCEDCYQEIMAWIKKQK